jgi:hypothetical protein
VELLVEGETGWIQYHEDALTTIPTLLADA